MSVSLKSPASIYIAGQILRLNKAMDGDDAPTQMTRYGGGHHRKTQPHISGHHHVFFFLPEMFLHQIVAASRWLTATCESFTPHTSSINTTDIIGFGQSAASVPISRTINREFTLGFREYQALPILRIMKVWQSIFVPIFGMKNTALPPLLYKGFVIVAVLKPTASGSSGFGLLSSKKIAIEDLEELYGYFGVYPITCPEDTVLASDQSVTDTVVVPITFKFDGSPIERGHPLAETLLMGLINDVNWFFAPTFNDVYDEGYVGQDLEFLIK